MKTHSVSTHAVLLERVSKTYAQKKTPAVNELSFSVRQGSFFGLLGPNGAGKSTTLQILSHLVRPDSGVIRVNGWDYYKNPFESKCSVGIVPQEFNFNLFETPRDIILTQGGYYGFSPSQLKKQLAFLLEICGLGPYADQPSRTLSGGMKRRLMIARALIHQPPLLILDEPTVGVDPQLREAIWTFLKELNQQGTTIILTSHYFEEVEALCDEIAMIQKGQLLLQLPTKEFLKKLPQQKLQCDLQRALSDLDKKELLNHFPQITFPQDDILIYPQNQGEYLGPLITFLESRNCGIVNIAPKKARLEQLFMSMIQREDRTYD